MPWVTETCFSCGGKGSWDEMGIEDCDACCGRGCIWVGEVPETCSKCGGSRTQTYCKRVYCGSCSGSGYMQVWRE